MADDPPEIKALKLQQALVDEQTALYNKQKAASDAQAAAISAAAAAQKAALGTVAGSGLTGAVTVGTGASNAEATLLAAKVANDAAAKIAAAITKKLDAAGATAPILVVAGTQKLSLGHWYRFKIGLDIAGAAFARATKMLDDARHARPKSAAHPESKIVTDVSFLGAVPTATAIGTALDLASKLGSYFQTDYAAAAATVTGVDDDLLAASVAGQLPNAYFPARWAGLSSRSEDPFLGLLKPLLDESTKAPGELNEAQTASKWLKDEAGSETNAQKKAQLNNVAAMFDRAADAFTAALKNADALIATLAAPDKDGIPAAMQIADEKTILEKLRIDGACILHVKLNNATGANYTKKNLWTFFGDMPFYVMGGVVVSYTLLEAASGLVVASGQMPLHGGYMSVDDVASAL
jgi:hypothetical protein